MDRKRVGHSLLEGRRTWARVAVPDNELLSAMLLYVLSVSPSLTRSTVVVCLQHRRRSSCTMFACYYFIMTSSSCYPAAPPVYPDLFFICWLFLNGCVSSFPLTTCILPVPQMTTKPNFSCQIPPKASPICGCIMRKKGRRDRNGGMSNSFFIFLEFYCPFFLHSFALLLFYFQAGLISPMAGSKQVGHVWHNPLTCSQA